MKYIGEKLRTLRKEKGMTLEEVAGKDFTKGYLSQIERGKVTPSFKVLTHIASQLKMDLQDLLQDGNQLDYQLAHLETLFASKKYNEVITYSKQISTDLQFPPGVKVILLQAKANYFLSHLSECRDLTKQILTIDRDWIPLYKLEAFVFLGLALFGQQRYREAIDIYDQGIAFVKAKDIKRPHTLANMYLNKATALQNLEQYEEAILEYSITLDYARSNKVMDTILDAFLRIGYCHYKKRLFDQAKEYIQKGFQINHILELELPQAEALLLLSFVYFEENNYLLAEKYAHQAHTSLTELNHTEPLSKNSLVESLIIITKIYLATGRNQKADATLQNLISKAEETTDLPSYIFKDIANLCMAIGQNEAANTFFARIVN